MAEIRKYNPETGNAIAQALSAAMGEPVRPRTPGAPAVKPHPAKQEPTEPPAVIKMRITTQARPQDDAEDD
ncbi:MAG TPA: hypothetical protein DCM67_03495 [Propionibacteriaceae bacterium]|nr:hypothetical protein [Propionibacteriaceae bacterium]